VSAARVALAAHALVGAAAHRERPCGLLDVCQQLLCGVQEVVDLLQVVMVGGGQAAGISRHQQWLDIQLQPCLALP
jgi:hypothetical protein